MAHTERIEEIMRDACADSGAEPREFNGEPDHAHLLVNFPPTMTISRLVNSLKNVPCRRLRQEFPELARHHWRPRGCGPGPTSPAHRVVPTTALRQYIEQQNRPPQLAHARPPSPA